MSSVAHLPPEQFNTVIRWIKSTDLGRLNQIRKTLAAECDRLAVKPSRKPAAGRPAGSDHFDSGALLDWVARITMADDDKEARGQLAVVYATVLARMEG